MRNNILKENIKRSTGAAVLDETNAGAREENFVEEKNEDFQNQNSPKPASSKALALTTTTHKTKIESGAAVGDTGLGGAAAKSIVMVQYSYLTSLPKPISITYLPAVRILRSV